MRRLSRIWKRRSDKGVDRVSKSVRNRVDRYGVSEPTIQKQGGKRVIVELPGVKDENEVSELLRTTAKLEFKMVKDAAISYKVMDAIDKFLAGKTEGDSTLLPIPQERRILQKRSRRMPCPS